MALMKHGVGKMFMMDASEGMLSKAKAKIDSMGFSDRVEIKQANLPIIPYDDNTFDFIMINQVNSTSFLILSMTFFTHRIVYGRIVVH